MGTQIVEPALGSSIVRDDVLRVDNKTSQLNIGLDNVVITNWNNTSQPQVAAGSIYEIDGTFFEESTNATVGSWTASGTRYLYATPSGSSTTWALSSTAPTWSNAKLGWYNGTARAFYKVVDGLKYKLNPQAQYNIESPLISGATLENLSSISFSTLSDVFFSSILYSGFITQDGDSLSVSGTGAPALTTLAETGTTADIAFFDNVNKQLRAYRWSKTSKTWALVGSGLTITGANAPGLAALNSTDVAFIDDALESLRTYRFNGSTWSLVGSGLTISGIGIPSLAALNSTDVAFIDQGLSSLRTYRFNGSTWSLVGSGLSIPGIGFPALTALDSTDVAFVDDTLLSLRKYRFNGSTWSLVGSGLSLPASAQPDITALTPTDIAFIDQTNDTLKSFRFNASTWKEVSPSLDIPGVSSPALATINSNTVAFIDGGNDQLRVYKRGAMLIE